MPNLNKTLLEVLKFLCQVSLYWSNLQKLKKKLWVLGATYSKFCDELIFEAISQKAFSGQL